MHGWRGVTSQKVKNYCSEGTRTLWATKAPLTYNCWMERRARRIALLQIHQSCQGPARHQHKFISTGEVAGKTQQLHIYWMTIPVRFTLKCRENIDKASHNDTSSTQIAGTDINNFNNSWKIQNWHSYGLLCVIYYSSTAHQLTSSAWLNSVH